MLLNGDVRRLCCLPTQQVGFNKFAMIVSKPEYIQDDDFASLCVYVLQAK